MKSSIAREMRTGTALATLPISSSVCMIFLIREGWKRELGNLFFGGILGRKIRVSRLQEKKRETLKVANFSLV